MLLSFSMLLLLLACSLPNLASPARTTPGTAEPCSDAPLVTELTFEGSCSPTGREALGMDFADMGAAYAPLPVEPKEEYDTPVQVRRNSLGYARVRSRLIFNANDGRNVLATIPSCTTILARGPTKMSPGSQGLGWAVRLVDPTGARCRGYISDTVLTPLLSKSLN